MLRIWMGRANTGKTRRVLGEIKRRGARALLLSPEHASHQAEVELCRACGPESARYAEVLSLRLLANRALALTGGLTDGTLDAGGKLLLMQLSLQEAASQLTVYARPSRKAPFLQELVSLCDELIAGRVLPEDLGDAAPQLEGMSGAKVRDLSLIYAAYLSRLCQEGADRRDLMEKLIDSLEPSGYAAGKDIYLDGFTYFTAQELKRHRHPAGGRQRPGDFYRERAHPGQAGPGGGGVRRPVYGGGPAPAGAWKRPGASGRPLLRPAGELGGRLRRGRAVPGGEHVHRDGVCCRQNPGAGAVGGLPFPGHRRGGPKPG